MEITFSFDDNDVSTEEPLGSVTVASGGFQFVAETVFLDDFFSGLITACMSSEATGSGSAELETEPDSIVIQRRHEGVFLQYGKKKLWIGSTKEFIRELRKVCQDFLQALPEGADRMPNFGTIRAFLNK